MPRLCPIGESAVLFGHLPAPPARPIALNMTLSPLDRPEAAIFAWARFRRIMRWWMLAATLISLGVLAWFFAQYGLVSIHFYIAAALGIGLTVLLTGALMSLVFLSSGTGHDESVRDFEPHDDGDDWRRSR